MATGIFEERTKYFWVETIASIAAPTVAEMGAAIDMTCVLASMPELTLSPGTVDKPTLCSRVIGNDPGTVSLGKPNVDYYLDDTPSSPNEILRTALEADTEGNIVRVDSVSGVVPPLATAGTVIDVWPATVLSNFKAAGGFGEEKKFTVGYSLTAVPALDVTVVA